MDIKDLQPPPPPETKSKRDRIIKAYVDVDFKRKFQNECQKRCMTESSVIMAALDEYFNPKQVVKYVQGSGILRVDREPKGSTATPLKKVHYGIVIKELKEKMGKGEALLKPIGSYDSEIKFIEV
ncbi:MAG: hypothetical protein ACFFDN_26615 [Candidatus Hodarchaeota archaeon]